MAQHLPTPNPSAYSDEPVRYPPLTLIDLTREADQFPRPYHNAVLSQVNSHCARLSAFEGIYPWHRHPGSDELFLVVEGELHIDFLEAPTIRVGPRQLVTIPAGMIHRTRAEERVVNICFEELAATTEFVPGPGE